MRMAMAICLQLEPQMKMNPAENVEIGRTYMVRRLDNTWHSAEVIHHRYNEADEGSEYYVHYANYNRQHQHYEQHRGQHRGDGGGSHHCSSC